MSKLLIEAIISITLALIFYTIGVWSERRAKVLKYWHVIVFWLGLIFDTIGTTSMTMIANSNDYKVKSGLTQYIHGITGVSAIILMLFHALWATLVMYRDNKKQRETFHRASVVVWSIWLIPYILGAIIGMSH